MALYPIVLLDADNRVVKLVAEGTETDQDTVVGFRLAGRPCPLSSLRWAGFAPPLRPIHERDWWAADAANKAMA